MAAFAARRFVSLLAPLFAAGLVIFLGLEVLPGDPASCMLGLNAQPDTVEVLRRELGLDRPAPERYLAWIGGLFTGDFGVSYTYRVPVAELIFERLWISLPLALMALVLTILI